MKFYSTIRTILRSPRDAFFRNFSIQVNENFSQVLNEANTLVNCPSPFLNFEQLLRNEDGNAAVVAAIERIEIDHPLVNTARDLIINKQSPPWGLIVLLVSKAGGLKKEFSQVDHDITAGILHSQRVLAEITEMIRTSNILHKSLLVIDKNNPDLKDLYFGNKLSLLTGDYLLSTCFRELAGLKNHDVNELISTCLRDLTEVQFIEPRDKQNRPLPAPPLKEQKDIIIPDLFINELLKISEVLGNAKAEWTLRHFLDGASLLAKCCQCTLMLGEHPESFQRLGYLFGRNMALAWQAHRDQMYFDSNKPDPFSLVCAPLLFHIQHDPAYHKKIVEYAKQDNIDYYEIRKTVSSGPGLQKTAELQDELSSNALKILEEFPDSEARTALANIINSL